jgi:lipopolysaccharide transport system permease protein
LQHLALRGAVHKLAFLNVEPAIVLADGESPTAAPSTQDRHHPFRVQATRGWATLNLRELWNYRDLLWILVERDIKLLYKQTALGLLAVILQPLIAAIIFAVIFGRVAKFPSDGTPYLLFVFCGLTLWTYFSQALQRAGNSLVRNSQLVSKVYFPRLLIPLAHTLSALVDFAVMIAVLFVLMAVYRITPTPRLVAVPALLLLTTCTATGIALFFSALSVKYRDFTYVLPFLVQVWMYASPVIWPISMIPARWHNWFALNPAVGFIEGFRWAVLGRSALNVNILTITIVMSFLILFSGAFFFRRVERSFADTI